MSISNSLALTCTAAAAALLASVASSNALPTPGAQQKIHAECTTRETGLDGRRHSCDASPSEMKAPHGLVINQNSLEVLKWSANGSAHHCTAEFSDYVEIIPGTGITQPTAIKLYAHARSPKGNSSGRGWVKCTANFYMVDFTPDTPQITN